MKKKNILWGSLLILTAIFIFVNKLGYFEEISLIKIIFTAILIGLMVTSIIHVNFAGILFPAAFICIMFEEEWRITQLTPWPVLAIALLGSIGLSMIFKNYHIPLCHYDRSKNDGFNEVIEESDSNFVDCFVSFGSSIKYINSDNFERANIKCSFGAMKVYFDNANIISDKADIFLDVSFSGVELYIPKTWNVIKQSNTTFGAVEEKNRKLDLNGPKVTLRGTVSFSGVEIFYI